MINNVDYTELDNIFTLFSDPKEAWNSKAARKYIAKEEEEIVLNAKLWKLMLTLTFEKEIALDMANKKFRRLIRDLNINLLGNNYTRIVGHSYFSYVMGLEYQQRGVAHFHLLVDKPLHFDYLHFLWNKTAGFSWITKIKDIYKSVHYVCKYVVKGGEVTHYFRQEDFYPKQIPFWWIEK